MNPGVTSLLIISGYLALLLFLGLFAGKLFKGTSKDYMLASHSIGPFLLLMSLFGTTMTAFALVGSSGESFKEGVGVYGMLASSSGIIHSLCFFLLGIKLWSWGKKYGYTTQIGFFRDRLESDKIGLLLFPILVGLVIPYLLIGVISSGVVINGVTRGAFGDAFFTVNGGIAPWLGSLVVCLVVLIYVFYGGMRGTAWANTFQTCVFMVLGVVTFYVIATDMAERRLKEQGIKREVGFFEALEIVSNEVPKAKLVREHVGLDDDQETRNKIRARLDKQEKFLKEKKPPVHKAMYTDKKSKELKPEAVKKKTVENLTTNHGLDPWRFFTYLLIPFSVGMFPHLFQHWLTAKSANSFKLAVVMHPIFIMIVWVPCVLIGVWATSWLVAIPPQATPNSVLAILVKSVAGPVLGGLLTAGILAAIMSSLDSQFLCLGTMFTKDIVTHYGGEEKYSDKQTVAISRMFIIGIVAVTYILANFTPLGGRRVFQMGVWCFSGFSALFPIAFLAIYWKGFTKWGAYAGVLAAAGSWGYLFYDSEFAGNAAYSLKMPLFGETVNLMPVSGMFVSTLGAAVIVSLITPKPSKATLAKFFPEKKSNAV